MSSTNLGSILIFASCVVGFLCAIKSPCEFIRMYEYALRRARTHETTTLTYARLEDNLVVTAPGRPAEHTSDYSSMIPGMYTVYLVEYHTRMRLRDQSI